MNKEEVQNTMGKGFLIAIITQLIDIIDKQQTELTKYAILYGANNKE